jgi:hypothetical protein
MNASTKRRFEDFSRQIIHTITTYSGKYPDAEQERDMWQRADEEEEEENNEEEREYDTEFEEDMLRRRLRSRIPPLSHCEQPTTRLRWSTPPWPFSQKVASPAPLKKKKVGVTKELQNHGNRLVKPDQGSIMCTQLDKCSFQ